MTHTKAKEILAKSRNNWKKLANNTWLEPVEGSDAYAIKLHKTRIITIHSDGSYTLDSGGWMTPTTKERLSTYGPVRIAQVAGVWYLQVKDHGIAFYDGMRFTPTYIGQVTAAAA